MARNQEIETATLQRQAARLVKREVHCCMSSLVATLARSNGCVFEDRDMAGLVEQAAELAYGVLDYESAARDAGFEVRHDMAGFYWCDQDEAAHEDEGNASVGFDGRSHYDTVEQAACECCHENSIDPYELEVYEHWAVSSWLADKLEAKGERVDRDFAGLIVWARTTTGQAIASDHVIETIVAETSYASAV